MTAPDPRQPPPHRIARTDQYLSAADDQLDALIDQYTEIVAEEGEVSAANLVALSLVAGRDQRTVGWIALAAIRRLANTPTAHPGQ